jgi:hypothetical protein
MEVKKRRRIEEQPFHSPRPSFLENLSPETVKEEILSCLRKTKTLDFVQSSQRRDLSATIEYLREGSQDMFVDTRSIITENIARELSSSTELVVSQLRF